ncbi:hypothetical protein AKO1_002454, partial [Acrasis kona]
MAEVQQAKAAAKHRRSYSLSSSLTSSLSGILPFRKDKTKTNKGNNISEPTTTTTAKKSESPSINDQTKTNYLNVPNKTLYRLDSMKARESVGVMDEPTPDTSATASMDLTSSCTSLSYKSPSAGEKSPQKSPQTKSPAAGTKLKTKPKTAEKPKRFLYEHEKAPAWDRQLEERNRDLGLQLRMMMDLAEDGAINSV